MTKKILTCAVRSRKMANDDKTLRKSDVGLFAQLVVSPFTKWLLSLL